MGCLIFLILAFIFRGAIIGLLSAFIGLVIGLLTFLLSLGLWGIIAIIVVCAIVAAFG